MHRPQRGPCTGDRGHSSVEEMAGLTDEAKAFQSGADEAPMATSHQTPPAGTSSFSIPRVVVAAVQIGSGLFLVRLWLVTITANWLYFLGLLPMTLGTYLLFRPTESRGPDRAP